MPGRASRHPVFLFAILASVLLAGAARDAGALGQDQELREARLAEGARDHAGAAGMYAHWLAAHPGAPLASSVLARYLAREQDLPSLVETAEKILKAPEAGPTDGSLLAKLARILEVAGRPEPARDMYLAAFARGAPPVVLEPAFLLSLEMNDIDSMAKTLADLKDAVGHGTPLLEAGLAWQRGDAVSANEALRRISQDSGDPRTALKALWMQSIIAARAGDQEALGDAQRKLAARFPRSPETALAAASAQRSARPGDVRVVPLPGPGAFFTEPPGASPAPPANASRSSAPPASAPAPAPAASAPATTTFELLPPVPPPETGQQPASSAPAASASAVAPSAPPTAAPAVKLSVQAGSFQMKENADDLVGELTRKGFSPVVRAESADGKPLYRVLAGSSLSTDDARVLLEKLHAAGFSGFLVKDQERRTPPE